MSEKSLVLLTNDFPNLLEMTKKSNLYTKRLYFDKKFMEKTRKNIIFEPEVALLVGLQVMNSKGEAGNFLTRFCMPGLDTYAGLDLARDCWAGLLSG